MLVATQSVSGTVFRAGWSCDLKAADWLACLTVWEFKDS